MTLPPPLLWGRFSFCLVRRYNNGGSLQKEKQVDPKEWEGREFWYGDAVKFPDRKGKEKRETFFVLGLAREVSSDEEHVYDYSDRMKGQDWFGWFSPQEEAVELVERGNFWKYAHGKKTIFADLREEVQFHLDVLEAYDTVTPDKKQIVWTKEDVLAAIKRGEVHGFTMIGMPIMGPDAVASIHAFRLHEEKLGKKLAKETLKGFRATK